MLPARRASGKGGECSGSSSSARAAPSATLDLTGVASYEVFLRGTFDRIGTYPDFLHVGDYKTAVNTYLEKGFTPAHKEMSESLNRSQYDQLVETIAAARSKGEAEVRELIDQGPFQPVDAPRRKPRIALTTHRTTMNTSAAARSANVAASHG